MGLQARSRGRLKIRKIEKNIMQTKHIQVSAPGKLILLGEYAVLEQAPCLVSAVQRDCIVQIKPRVGHWFSIDSSRSKVPNVECVLTDEGDFRFKNELSTDGYKRLRFVLSTLKHVLQQAEHLDSSASIFINTDQFFHRPSEQKLGLGASAAITVSLMEALIKFTGRQLDDQERYHQAFQIHRNAQGGLGSGMDIAASSTGGIIEYQMRSDMALGGAITPVEWPRNLQMIPVWAGHSASTQNMVQQVQAFQDANPNQYDSIMEPMIKLSETGCRAFKSNDVEGFLDVVLEYVDREQELGAASGADIISEVHRDIGNIVHQAGGSYKPSGAGGGDIGVAFCQGEEAFLAVKRALEKSRFDILNLPLQNQKSSMIRL